MTVTSGVSVTISGLTITGRAPGNYGGGISNGGKLTLEDSTVSDNGATGSHGFIVARLLRHQRGECSRRGKVGE